MKKQIVLILIFSFIIFSCKKNESEPETISVEYNEEVKKPIAENAEMTKVSFNIEGMTCAIGCAAKIEKSLAKMDGVESAKVDFDSKTATVSYDVNQVNTNLLTERVKKNGSQFKVSNFETQTN